MGRPAKEINWEIVEKRIEAGCNGIEIAASLRVDSDTFYGRFKEQYGKSFQDFSAFFYKAGDANIKFTQYMKAMSGNIAMLQLLGRERLGQSKEQERVPSNDEVKALEHQNMLLEYELMKTRENAKESQADNELCRSDPQV